MRPCACISERGKLRRHRLSAADLAPQRHLVEYHVDLWRYVAAEEGLLPGGAGRHPPVDLAVFQCRPGSRDDRASVILRLEEAGHDVRVDLDSRGVGFQADIRAG